MSISPPITDSLVPAGTWSVDPTHTRIGFVARHMMVAKVRGSFSDYSADVEIGENPLDSRLAAEVRIASIDTGNADRDEHLRTGDFFDVEQFPTMSLRSTSIEAHGDRFVLNTDLTIKGVTRPVAFDLEVHGVGRDPWGGLRAGFTATADIDRTDWGLVYNAALETGGVLIGEKVKIELDVELVRS